MANLPGRATDAGPSGHSRCPVCDSKRWSTISYCVVCTDTMCDACPGADNFGDDLVCKNCLPAYQAAQDESQCNAIAQLHVIDARVQYANIPEWNKGPVN